MQTSVFYKQGVTPAVPALRNRIQPTSLLLLETRAHLGVFHQDQNR